MAYQDRDYRRSAVEFDDTIRTRTVTRSPAPAAPRSRRGEFDDFDVRVRERDGDLPDFLRSSRRPEAGPMVLRQREVDTYERQPREPSPIRYREERIVRRAHSVSPSEPEHEHSRTRIVDKIRSPSVARRRSPSPRAVRYVEPSDTSEHIRIVERERDRVPSPSPSPPPAPPVIRGPVIEREVITHYTDIDHGMIQARQPSPPPSARPRPRERETRETDIDISVSKGRTEVDIHRSASRTRSKSRERRSSRYYDDDVVVRRDLKIEEPKGRRRAHSAAARPAEDDEAEYITSKLDGRGRMGEAWGGVTKNWAIVDVPPGTERIRMDGAGGGSTDTTWSKYSGVRRTKFLPERERDRDRDDASNRAPSPPPALRGERVSVSVLDREREIEIDRVTDRRAARSPAPPPPKEMWTEITKDLVVREAIEELGYEYEETDMFFYIMDYLKYDDVLQLTELSDDIRRSKRQRARDSIRFDRERDYYEEIDRRATYDRRPAAAPRRDERERVRETEVVYDRAPAPRYR
ncbi:2-isopropylmalate synthase [Trichoderma cornu-damae]|uniref:2-isopropylmalate synthase n=1 Tax=Trichoderma cornu-damae TaxID=654480 RepID=A0A9P8QLE6_9HYPO|nr:2-isopropylmalate synthase [Trichoderma cornu-damae]